MFKSRRRSAHGFFSSPQRISPVTPTPTQTVKFSGMGSVSEAPAPMTNSVKMNPDADRHVDASADGAIGEPLVQDFQQMDDGHASNVQRPPLTPPPEKAHNLPLGSHPVDIQTPDEDTAPPPPDFNFTHRGIHIPSRTSSTAATTKRRFFRSSSGASVPTRSMPTTPDSHSRVRSSADSVISQETSAPSIATTVALVPLQQKIVPEGPDRLSPLLEDDPKSFDLVAPNEGPLYGGFSLEARSEQLFSREHLQAIFEDTPSLLRFTAFLSAARPKSVPVLIYYLDALKAIRAIEYANAVAEALEPIEGHEFTETAARPTVNAILEDKAKSAFDVLVRDDLPAFITHIFIQVVSVSIQKRITGSMPPLLRESSEGLAEVFCLTDPSRTDNPIIFASEEFHRTTQYGVGYVIGRNCRFLQGPKTNRNTTARLRQAVEEGKEISEVFLNYRRDGSPFMNLLMMAPLLDSRGNLRYFIGAQVDVSGLVKDSTDLEAFQRMLDRAEGHEPEEEPKDEFQQLSEMFNHSELETVRKFGGNMHKEHVEDQDDASIYHRPRVLIKDTSTFDVHKALQPPTKPEGRLCGVYKHYLLVRPGPSFRILFTSPSLRVPGILQSYFLDRIGGSTRVRDSIAEALADGSRGVTAKIRWLPHSVPDLENSDEEGRPRWIHCTPLLGQTGTVGVWMIVLVDDKESQGPVRRFRPAPPVPNDLRSKVAGQAGPSREAGEGRTDSLDSRAGSFSLMNGTNASPLPRHVAGESIRRPGSALSDFRSISQSPRPGSPDPLSLSDGRRSSQSTSTTRSYFPQHHQNQHHPNHPYCNDTSGKIVKTTTVDVEDTYASVGILPNASRSNPSLVLEAQVTAPVDPKKVKRRSYAG